MSSTKPVSITQTTSNNAQAAPSNWDKLHIGKFGWEQFQRGEAHQRKKDEDEFNAHLMKNINKATTLSESIFYTAIEDFSVNVVQALLKLESPDRYETIFFVNRKDYLSANLKEVYKKSHAVKADFNCSDFYISFKFMPFSEDLNADCLHGDGYIFAYGKRRKKSSARSTQ